jgi:UDP-GlcNAc:undecaprenyl-phosphate GlcNAc-1-phosphate transferase
MIFPHMELFLTTTVIAACVSLVLTPVVIRVSRRCGLVDNPDNRRKLHGRSVPLGGGVVLLASFLVGCAVCLLIPSSYAHLVGQQADLLVGLSLASLVICIVGLIDDRYGLRGRQKLLGQILAVSILLPFDIVIHRISLFGYSFELGLLAIPFTYFWLLGAINALNLIDGADGLATTVGTVLCLTLCILGFATLHYPEAILAMIFLGSLLGFLVYNLPPARIFLGDAGSMLIGLILATLAIRGSLKGPATVALAVPLAIWGILILDVGMAILRRKLTGRSLYATDRGHFHHVLQNHGLGHGGTVLRIGSLCALSCAAAIASQWLQNDFVAIGSIAAIAVVLVLTRSFGHKEMALLARKTRSFASTFIPHPSRVSGESLPTSSHLQGHRDWERHWNELREFAVQLDLQSVQLDISIPSLHEEYHASWTRRRIANEPRCWRLGIPLMAQDLVLGRVVIAAEGSESSACDSVADAVFGLRQFEVGIVDHYESLLAPTVQPAVPDTRLEDTVPLKVVRTSRSADDSQFELPVNV